MLRRRQLPRPQGLLLPDGQRTADIRRPLGPTGKGEPGGVW
jgi:hypothetical protein